MFLLSKYVKFSPTESFEKINHSIYISYFYITVQKHYDQHIFIEEFIGGLQLVLYRQGTGTVTGSLNIDTQSQGRANCSAVGF